MRLEYLNGTIEVNSVSTYSWMSCLEMTAKYDGFTYSEYVQITDIKWLFFKKTREQYINDVAKAKKQLIDNGMDYIHKMQLTQFLENAKGYKVTSQRIDDANIS